MNIRKNAQLTLRGRQELIDRTQQGAGLGATAAQLGVSRLTAGKWVARYREEGPAGRCIVPRSRTAAPGQLAAGAP
jgi:transposase